MKKLIFLLALFFFIFQNASRSQNLFFEGEKVETIDLQNNWYIIIQNGKIIKCTPNIQYIHDPENDFTGNIITSNDTVQSPILLIFNSNKKLTDKKFDSLPRDNNFLKVNDPININSNFILLPIISKLNNEEIFSLFIKDKEHNIQYEVFRNCHSINLDPNISANSYYGCGHLPFQIEFIGDIINDNTPEIILSADKEGSVLKLVLGFINGKFEVIKWTEFE